MNIIMILLIVFMVYMTINNIKQINANKQQKKYVEAYKKMLNGDEDTYTFVCEYINEEEDPLFKNKALVVKAAEELKKDDVDAFKKDLDNFDIAILFMKKDKFSFNEYMANSDTFLWLIYSVLVANSKNNKEVITYIQDKFKDFDSTLSEYVEYAVLKSLCIAFTKGLNEDTKIFKLLLDGEYSAYKYDKRVIGLYKRISAMALLYKKEEVEEEWKADQSSFSETLIGGAYLKLLGVYEIYHKEEPKEEDETKEDEEVKELEAKEENKVVEEIVEEVKEEENED